MHYIIFNLNALGGYQRGVFRNLYPVYLQEVSNTGEKTVDWTEDLTAAKVFATESAAWEFAISVWDEGFVMSILSVMSVNGKAIEADHYRKVATG